MACVAVVDDIAVNRELVATILKPLGHRIIEAADGAAALELVRRETPDLVICDILMPALDGYEFVRQLRAEETPIADTPVVFYTAYYLDDEAHQLARACGVVAILPKPSDPEDVIRVVNAALEQRKPDRKPELSLPEFDRQHVQLMTGKLAQQVAELQLARGKLEALVELNLQLASQTDLHRLLSQVCSSACQLTDAASGMVVARGTEDEEIAYAVNCGLPPETAFALGPVRLGAGLLGAVYRTGSSVCRSFDDGTDADIGLPEGYPRVGSLVAAPLASLQRIYGWICLTDKQGEGGFTLEDRKLLDILAAQTGRIYENGTLYRRATEHARLLEAEIVERQRAEQHLRAQYEVARVLAQATSLTQAASQMLQALGRQLEFAAAAVWTVDPGNQTLHCLDAWCEPPAECRAWTAALRKKALGKESVPGKVWTSGELRWFDDFAEAFRVEQSLRDCRRAAKAGFRSGGAFPIVVDGEITGVVGVFSRARRPFDDRLVATLVSLGNQIGQFVERNAQQKRIQRLTRLYAVLSRINSAVVRIRERESLFGEVCRIAVEAGEFCIAWVGECVVKTLEVRPVAWAGLEERNAALELAPLLADRERDIATRAVKTGEPVIANDVLEADLGGLRLPEWRKRGYRSKIALPLEAEGEVAAVLVLYAPVPGFFAGEELQLLRDLAGDVSFALEYLAKRDRLAFLAYHDVLTGLPNRAHLHEHLAQALVRARKHPDDKVAVVVWNLNRFRNINETFGRQVGDAVLREIARRFASVWPSATDFARIGVDHFAGVVHDRRDVTEIAHLVEEVAAAVLGVPVAAGEHELLVTGSAGIAVFTGGHEDAETLVRNAEAALRKAKGSALSYVFYEPEMNARIAEALMLENRLRQALERDEFVLHYQPKVSGSNGEVTGLEALMRWNDPKLGLVPPAKFIPILEETGLILQVGLWAIQRALTDACAWRAAGIEAPRIAVNVSAIQLQQHDFVDSVRATIGEVDGERPLLDLELTESMLMTTLEENIARLEEIRRMGGDIAIDDFGTGYSSLGYLAKLPVSALKIDKSFIETMNAAPESMTIVSTIISLAHSLDLSVIAEGVETEEQAECLRRFNCNQLQGFLISPPLPPERVVEYLHGASRSGNPPAGGG